MAIVFSDADIAAINHAMGPKPADDGSIIDYFHENYRRIRNYDHYLDQVYAFLRRAYEHINKGRPQELKFDFGIGDDYFVTPINEAAEKLWDACDEPEMLQHALKCVAGRKLLSRLADKFGYKMTVEQTPDHIATHLRHSAPEWDRELTPPETSVFIAPTAAEITTSATQSVQERLANLKRLEHIENRYFAGLSYEDLFEIEEFLGLRRRIACIRNQVYQEYAQTTDADIRGLLRPYVLGWLRLALPLSDQLSLGQKIETVHNYLYCESLCLPSAEYVSDNESGLRAALSDSCCSPPVPALLGNLSCLGVAMLSLLNTEFGPCSLTKGILPVQSSIKDVRCDSA